MSQLTVVSNKAYDKYMSDGLCYGDCNGSAFAIVQGFNCWCSDYEPAESTQSDISECNKSCPGYPDDTCGGDGLYGYMAMGEEPSGTKGGDSSTAPATSTTKVSTLRFYSFYFCTFFTPGTGSCQTPPGLRPCPTVWFGSNMLANCISFRGHLILTSLPSGGYDDCGEWGHHDRVEHRHRRSNHV